MTGETGGGITALKNNASKLLYNTPSGFENSKKALEKILPLLGSDDALFVNRGMAALLVHEAKSTLKKEAAEVEGKKSRGDFFVPNTVIATGVGMLLWGQIAGEVKGFCEAMLKVGGVAAIIAGFGAVLHKIFKFNANLNFPVQFTSLMEKIEMHINALAQQSGGISKEIKNLLSN